MFRESIPSINEDIHRFPFCVVWTPIPLITWLFPFIGHMGIGTSKGIIRDFAGSYYVSEDDMAFGWPTCFLPLTPVKVNGGVQAWDNAVRQASDEYKSHVHNLICDNCHSHTALALNLMSYDGKSNWNMVNLCALMFFKGKRLGVSSYLSQFLPFILILLIIGGAIFVTSMLS